MVKKILLGVVGLVLALVAIGFVLPRETSFARSVEIAAPADRIYPLVSAPRAWPRWSVWNQRDPNMELGYSGTESGTGAAWSWKSKSEGNGGMTFTAGEPGKRVSYELTFEGMSPSRGDITLEPAGTGTRVTWSMRGDMGSSPINRWFGVFLERMVAPDFEGGLANLKKLAESGG
jgi:uncharacterized protein YndB with AHSA1/START domain